MTDPQDTTNPSTATPPAVTAQSGAVVENNFSPVIQNNITIQAPAAAPSSPGRRAGGGARRSGGPRESEARASRGFALDAPTVNVEAMRAQQNDEDQRNVDVRIEAQRSAYSVNEETRRRPGSNNSLQSVGAVVDTAQSSNTRAFVLSTQGQATSIVEGYANGTVMLTHTQNGVQVRTDITGASRDVTASGIRLLQQNIAADGEVDRVEQQQIINLVNQAKELAAARR